MEKVQFQLEATLPELKDLHEKGLFTKTEIDQITRRRTTFETSLIRRQTRKDDFFHYAEYEINLERLRKVRWKRLGYDKNPPPHSASSYSLPRRAIYILKRATAKFPGDLAVWLAYVEYASQQRMRKIVAKGLTTALQHHPLSPTLYLLLSYHHLHPNSPFPRDAIPSTSKLDLPSATPRDTGFSIEGTSAARTQLLLGLRLIPQSEVLWTEYIKLELGWVEALRRRWNVLGINEDVDPQTGAANPDSMTGGEGSFGPEGEDARKSILAGQLVLHAIQSALKAIKEDEGLEFRLNLVEMLRRYPSALRGKCLDAVFMDLESLASGTSRSAARARLAILTRRLYEAPYVAGEENKPIEGIELVEEVGRIGKAIRKRAKDGSAFLEVAAEWLGQQTELQAENEDLRSYLLSISTALTSAKYSPPASVLLLHLRLAQQYGHDADLLKTIRSHAGQHPTNASLQLIRLQAELQHDPKNAQASCASIVKTITPAETSNSENEIRKVWFTWTSIEESTAGADIDSTWASILALSTKINRPDTHSALLGRYFISTLQRSLPLSSLQTIDSFAKYRATQAIYPIAWAAVSTYSIQPYVELGKLYERWRSAARTSIARIEAALTWAEWLLSHRKAHEASRIVDSVRREDPVEVEKRWKVLCDDAETQNEAESKDKLVELESKLREIGWAGLGTPDGMLLEQDANEGAAEDESMAVEDEDEDDEQEDEVGEDDEDSEMDINV